MANYILFIVAIATSYCLATISAQANDSQPMSSADLDEKKFQQYKDQVCGAVPAFKGGDANAAGGSKWSDSITDEEILELAFVNMAYGLTSDSVSHLKSELGWKKSVIDIISLITKSSCSDEVISEPFLNAAKNLFLYYLVKRQKSDNSFGANITEKRATEWKEILDSLTECSKGVGPIEIVLDCGKATEFVGKDRAAYGIRDTFERFDQELRETVLGLDLIIDTVWWMFSTTYARCYSYFYPNEDVILLFYQMFREDFLLDFLNRWRSAGPLSEHFPLIFGPIDSFSAARNTRKCCSASYQYESLAERQLVRPVFVLVNNAIQRNFKITTQIA